MAVVCITATSLRQPAQKINPTLESCRVASKAGLFCALKTGQSAPHRRRLPGFYRTTTAQARDWRRVAAITQEATLPLPLPEGERWGEGEENDRPAGAPIKACCARRRAGRESELRIPRGLAKLGQVTHKRHLSQHGENSDQQFCRA